MKRHIRTKYAVDNVKFECESDDMEAKTIQNLALPKNPIQLFGSLDISEATRLDYAARSQLFLDYIQTNGLNRDSFLHFKRMLAARNDVSVATKNKYLAVARIVLKEFNRLGWLPVDITHNIKSFRQSKRHKVIGLTDSEMQRLAIWMQQLPDTSENARRKVMVALLALQGLRQIEIVRMDVGHLQLSSGLAYIQGKGMDDREAIYLHPETIKLLRKYLQSNRLADGPLFVSLSNNSKNVRLSTRSLRYIVQELLKAAGVNKTTHGFRHFFTTKLVKDYQGDLLQVAQYTRHRSLEMLQTYYDGVKQEQDLPRFRKTFSGVKF